jgi:hypothetical protein
MNSLESGLEVVCPPVIFTLEIVTFGSRGANASPIVSTGPPPLMIVFLAPEPITLTLLSMVRPPAKVPGSTRITPPLWAASTASWTVSKHGGSPTQRSFAVDAPLAAGAIASTIAVSAPAISAALIFIISFCLLVSWFHALR